MRPELLGEPSLIMEDQLSRRPKYLLGTAVIDIQCHTLRSSIAFRKGQHNIRSGSPESIDGLIVVPHNKNIILGTGKHPNIFILKLVDILEFINENIAEQILPSRPDIRSRCQKLVRIHYHIVKIQCPVTLQPFLISPVDIAEHLLWTIGRVITVNIDPIAFYLTDFLLDILQKLPAVFHIKCCLLQGFFQKTIF